MVLSPKWSSRFIVLPSFKFQKILNIPGSNFLYNYSYYFNLKIRINNKKVWESQYNICMAYICIVKNIEITRMLMIRVSLNVFFVGHGRQ